jgi:DNA-binding CsgD family transcriptional regulator/tetratricopeptide (TPR) repeat protein
LSLASTVAAWLGDNASAIDHAQEALANGRALSDPIILGRAWYNLGDAWEHAGEGARAAAAYAEAVPLFREVGLPAWVAAALSDYGDKLMWGGDVVAALPLLEEALALNRQIGYRWGIARGLGHLGIAALMQGDLSRADRFFTESISLAEEIGDARLVLGAVMGVAGVALARGEPELASRLLGAVDAARAEAGTGRPAHALHRERIESAVRDALGDSRFAAAYEAGRGLSFDEAVAEATGLAAPEQLPPTPRDAGLTSRELDVLRLLVEGKSDREIAQTLFIGTRTVQTHISNLFAKLGVNARAEAAAVAVRRGFV